MTRWHFYRLTLQTAQGRCVEYVFSPTAWKRGFHNTMRRHYFEREHCSSCVIHKVSHIPRSYLQNLKDRYTIELRAIEATLEQIAEVEKQCA